MMTMTRPSLLSSLLLSILTVSGSNAQNDETLNSFVFTEAQLGGHGQEYDEYCCDQFDRTDGHASHHRVLEGCSDSNAGAMSACFCGLLQDYQVHTTDDQPSNIFSTRDDNPDENTETICVNGFAAKYPCDNVHLLSFVPLNLFDEDKKSTNDANDVWGWSYYDDDSGTTREFALIGLTDGVGMVEITDPVNPVVLGRLASTSGTSLWRDIKVYKDYAYIVSEKSNHGLQIFDLKKHLLTASQTSFTNFSPDVSWLTFRAHNIVINEDTGYAYIVGRRQGRDYVCNGGMSMIDIRNPTQPVELDCATNSYTHDAHCVIYNGPDTAYVGNEICFLCNTNHVAILDVTDKDSPVILSERRYSDSQYTHQGWLSPDHRFFVFGDELDETRDDIDTTILSMDVTNLNNPGVPGRYTSVGKAAIDHNLYIKSFGSTTDKTDIIYLANYRAGMRILQVNDYADVGPSDRSNGFQEIAYFDTYPDSDSASYNGAWGVYPYFESGTVIVSSIGEGLFVLRPDIDQFLPDQRSGDLPSVSISPSKTPTSQPSSKPSTFPSGVPSIQPSLSSAPSWVPSSRPSTPPSDRPSKAPSMTPSAKPSATPSDNPSSRPTGIPSNVPSSSPSRIPTEMPVPSPITPRPTPLPSSSPSTTPTLSSSPSFKPTTHPSDSPSSKPTTRPSFRPSLTPSFWPSGQPSASAVPSATPSLSPSSKPSLRPSQAPSPIPSSSPSGAPNVQPAVTELLNHSFENLLGDFDHGGNRVRYQNQLGRDTIQLQPREPENASAAPFIQTPELDVSGYCRAEIDLSMFPHAMDRQDPTEGLLVQFLDSGGVWQDVQVLNRGDEFDTNDLWYDNLVVVVKVEALSTTRFRFTNTGNKSNERIDLSRISVTVYSNCDGAGVAAPSSTPTAAPVEELNTPVPVADVWRLISFTDFEDNWGVFNDGGGDARRSSSDGAEAFDSDDSRNHAIRLRDNSDGRSSMYSDELAVSGLSEIQVQFDFYAVSMESNEDFFIEVWFRGDSSWQLMADYVSGDDFENDILYNNVVATYSVPTGGRTGMWIRFRCDASSNGDLVYIDNVSISGKVDRALE